MGLKSSKSKLLIPSSEVRQLCSEKLVGRIYRITARHHHFSVKVISNEQATVAWLLNKVKLKHSRPENVLGLRTACCSEILDSWLLDESRILYPLKTGQELIVMYRERVAPEIGQDHFEPIEVIGRGGFSSVILGIGQTVRKRDTGKLYADKKLSKAYLLTQSKVSQVYNEREVLAMVNSPFVIKLHWAYQTVRSNQDISLHFVTEFCPGGELFYLLQRVGRLSESQALFYFGEVVLGLEHLHSLDIVYRDLKPENILLDLDGHVKLADFGLSKQAMSIGKISYTFCGSPEYMSPEMLKRNGHSRSVDLYSLGALLYEMLTGLPPFYNKSKEKMYSQVLTCKLAYPRNISPKARALLKSLLCKEQSLRLGSDKAGLASIKTHPWCSKLNWQKLAERQIDPPFRPSLTTSNFDIEYTKQPLDECEGVCIDSDFNDFDYNSEEPQSIEEQTSMRTLNSFELLSNSCDQTVILAKEPVADFEETKCFTENVDFNYPVYPYQMLTKKRKAQPEEYQNGHFNDTFSGRVSIRRESLPNLSPEPTMIDDEARDACSTPKSPVLIPMPSVFTALRDSKAYPKGKSFSFRFDLIPMDQCYD